MMVKLALSDIGMYCQPTAIKDPGLVQKKNRKGRNKPIASTNFIMMEYTSQSQEE